MSLAELEVQTRAPLSEEDALRMFETFGPRLLVVRITPETRRTGQSRLAATILVRLAAAGALARMLEAGAPAELARVHEAGVDQLVADVASRLPLTYEISHPGTT